MKRFHEELKRSLLTYRMVLVIVFMCAVAYRALIINNAFSYRNSEFLLYTDCFATSGMSYFIALFAVIPYATIFCDEYNSGYVKYILPKTGFINYFRRRIIFVGLSGAIAIGISLVVIFTTILIIGEPYDLDDISILDNGIWYNVIIQGDIYLFFALKLLLGLLYGTVWASAGFAVSTWFTNKYVAILTPFVINQLLWVALSEYSYINPMLMFRGDFGTENEFVGSFAYIIIFQIILFTVFVLLSYFGMKRKLRDV